MSNFKREDRYLVLKRSDLEAAGFTGVNAVALQATCERVAAERAKRGQWPLKAVVVEEDWPEYELVYKLIEMRMAGIDVAFTVLSILRELERALKKFPTWPTDPIHAAAVVQEEAGELVQGALQATYEEHKSSPKDVRAEAVQTGAMAIRWLMSFGRYHWQQSIQHDQVSR